MKKITALFLIISLLLISSYTLVACGTAEPPNVDLPPTEDNDPISVIVPPERDYGRESVDFDELKYTRPDIDSIAESISAVAALIRKNELSFDEEIAKISEIEKSYSLVLTMYTLAEIRNMKNSADEYGSQEYEYMSTGYPRFTDAVEELLVACALSPDRERFEREYFGYSLEEYTAGERYTERAVELLAREAELEAEYSLLSTATVEITYLGEVGTVESILEGLRDSYGESSAIYMSAYDDCMRLYYEKMNSMSSEIFIKLLRVRALIADELGYDSYTEYAYETMGHDYSPEEMLDFLGEVKNTVYPVFSRLYTRVFKGYFHDTELPEPESAEMINTLYRLFEESGEDLLEAYSYMLQHGLYDVSYPIPGRFDGSFTTYIEGNSSPYLFVTRGGTSLDYLTLAHEFGHFYDGYKSYGMSTSLDLAEISSQGLELLSVKLLSSELDEDEARYLEYYEMYSLLDLLITESFFSAFEHYVYELEYDEISPESIERAVARASELIFGSPVYTELSAVLIPHTVLYPHYVQSYCTSAVSALEIYFMECDAPGAGVDVYLGLIASNRDGKYTDILKSAGLTSPFESYALREVCDKIHFRILGSHYFKEQSGGAGSA